MMNAVYPRRTFSKRNLLQPVRPEVPHHSATNLIPTDGNTLAKKRIFRPIPPKGRHTKEWTTIAWPTNIQSRTPDGKFGPAMQMQGWGDCWFLAALAAVANDRNGQKILAESIKKINGGYDVTFMGSPNDSVLISDAELQDLLDINGGDADTRLMEVAADKFFKERGRFKSLYLAIQLKKGMSQIEAEACLQRICQANGIQDPTTHNPMSDGGDEIWACYLFTGMHPDTLKDNRAATLQEIDIMAYLNRYAINDRDGVAVIMNGQENPLGNTDDAEYLVLEWDVIRTDITSNKTIDPQQRAFLNALRKWLETPDDNTWQDLQSAAGNLRLPHIDLEIFIDHLDSDQISLRQNHRDLLRSGVQEVLAGEPGYIGFSGNHAGTIEGINKAENTFTYCEPHNPTLVHTGKLSNLIQAILSGNVELNAVETPTERDDGESSEHAGRKRARHLLELHHHVVGDGKIDPAESGPLAHLIEMDDGAFWQAYDSDKDGVIEGGELKAVQLRVDRWVDHFKLTPIW